MNLQIESLRVQNTALEERNRDLQHQVDKWQTLEDRGEKEAEALRKRRVELEVLLKEHEVSHRAAEKKIAKLEVNLSATPNRELSSNLCCRHPY